IDVNAVPARVGCSHAISGDSTRNARIFVRSSLATGRPAVRAYMSELRARFMAIAADPRIIPGVHHHCDEWCDHCHVTDRCLEFRCTNEFRKVKGRKEGDQTFVSID